MAQCINSFLLFVLIMDNQNSRFDEKYKIKSINIQVKQKISQIIIVYRLLQEELFLKLVSTFKILNYYSQYYYNSIRVY